MRTPWQNGYAQRLVGSIRRDCLDHVVVFSDRHLRHLLDAYHRYDNEVRTHLSLRKDTPVPRGMRAVGRYSHADFGRAAPSIHLGLSSRQGQGSRKMTGPSLTELDQRIAMIRQNINDLIEQAAAYSGAEDESRGADRIAEQEQELARMIKLREALLKR
jgi:hypothetical protein